MGDFKVGDVVKLKSGSPNMTVSQKLKEDIYCVWHDGEDFRNKAFPADTLQKVYTGN